MPKAILINGNCFDHLEALQGDILLSDPPYGIGYKVNARPKDRERARKLKATRETVTVARAQIQGDAQPFDPVPWLLYPKIALFGANYFSSRLPDTGRWIIWDKRRDSAPDDHSDCELIWTNVSGAHRIHRQKWRGVVREGEENCSRSKKLHPNQKPVALLAFILGQLGAGMTVCDPYMGSGSTGVAALRAGYNFVGSRN